MSSTHNGEHVTARCDCVGQFGANPDCSRCGGDGSYMRAGQSVVKPHAPVWRREDDESRRYCDVCGLYEHEHPKAGSEVSNGESGDPMIEPAVAYVFLHRRPTDKQAWPVIYTDKVLAEDCKYRVSEMVKVQLPIEVKP